MTTNPSQPRPRRRAKLAAAWFASFALVIGSTPSFTLAQEAKPKEKKSEKGDKGDKKADAKFDIQVMAIQATKKNSNVDDELKPMTKRLQDAVPGYTGFKLLKKVLGSAEKGTAFDSDLPSGFKIKVTPEERNDDMIKLRVKITPPSEKGKEKEKDKPDDLGTLIEIKRGTSQPYTFKHPEDKEDRIVIAVSAK